MPDDDVKARVTNLEQKVARLREQVNLISSDAAAVRADAAAARADAAASRVLAAGADRDVSEVRAELRAHTQALNALRESQVELHRTQLEQGRSIDELRQEMRGGFPRWPPAWRRSPHCSRSSRV